MARHALMAFLVLLIVLSASEVSFGRTWTDRKGRQLEAEYVGFKDGKVKIRRKSDGRVFDLSLDMLSEEDKSFVKAQLSSQVKRDWWIRDVKIDKTGPAYVIALGVSSSRTDLFPDLNEKSWETTEGGASVTFFISLKDHPDDAGMSLLAMGGNIGAILKKTSLRIKGEKNWVSLATYIQIDKKTSKYIVAACSRCGAVVKVGAAKCENCGARLAAHERDANNR